jgi:adenylate cyclase
VHVVLVQSLDEKFQPFRLDYAAIGSVVNLAARLCSSASAGQILVSQAVKMELGEEATLRPLPAISLKGFHAPVEIFEVSMAAKG